jgi:hypothetical protein
VFERRGPGARDEEALEAVLCMDQTTQVDVGTSPVSCLSSHMLDARCICCHFSLSDTHSRGACSSSRADQLFIIIDEEMREKIISCSSPFPPRASFLSFYLRSSC